METWVLMPLAVVAIGLVAARMLRGGRSRSWDNTAAWDALKRVGHEASRDNDARVHPARRED